MLTVCVCVWGRGKHSWFAFQAFTNCRDLEIGIEITAMGENHLNQKHHSHQPKGVSDEEM